jgi:hypothetical protein
MKKRSALGESPFRGDARVETANVDICFHHANPTHHSKDQPSSKSHWKKKKERKFNKLNKSLEQGLNLSGS